MMLSADERSERGHVLRRVMPCRMAPLCSSLHGVELPTSRYAPKRDVALLDERQSRPGHQVCDGPRDEHLSRTRQLRDPTGDMNGDARDVVGPKVDLSGVKAGA